MHQWRAVTSESGHAICMPKSDHKNRYVMGVRFRVANRPLLKRTVLYLTLSVLVLYEVQKCPLF